MDNNKFIEVAKKIVVDHLNEHVNLPNKKRLTKNDVFVVWLCKILQNNKALLATQFSEGLYYEVTYDGDKNEFYVDVYEKQKNYCPTDVQ